MSDNYIENVIEAWEYVREQQPLVQCLTNTVVQQFTANLLLAAGCSPAMVDVPVESRDFAAVASATLINLGTIAPSQQLAMLEAASSAHKSNTPWVLDPVAVGGLSVRTQLAYQLLESHPTVIRGNASEIIALAGGSGGRGTDAVATVEEALPQARELAQKYGSIIAISGPVDMITDGERTINCANGHPWLTKVTGAGCALGALVAGYSSFEPSEKRLLAVAAAHTVMGIAADRAAQLSVGPGSFAVQLIDQLYTMDADIIRNNARLS